MKSAQIHSTNVCTSTDVTETSSQKNDQQASAPEKKITGDNDLPPAKDVIFMDITSQFHLWHPAQVTVDEIYDSPGHYLVTKSLGTESLLQCLLKVLHSLIMCAKRVPV